MNHGIPCLTDKKKNSLLLACGYNQIKQPMWGGAAMQKKSGMPGMLTFSLQGEIINFDLT